MIYEVRTYDLRPHTLAKVERRLAAACAEAVRRGVLAASFHTEIGPLNQIVQIWACGGDDERESVLDEASAAGAAIAAHVVAERAEAFVPLPCSPAVAPGALGPFFEIRTYRYAAGELPKIVAAWDAALPARLELGPLVLVAHAEAEGADTLLHIWPYASLDERWARREQVRRAEIWPPPVVARRLGLPAFELLRMESKIAVPAAFSPLR